MNCRVCGTPLSSGIAICPSCGTPVTTNSTVQGAGAYAPTMQGADAFAPTVLSPRNTPPAPPPAASIAASNYGYQIPQDPYQSAYTSYGTNPNTLPQNSYATLPQAPQPYSYPPGPMPVPGTLPVPGPYSQAPKRKSRVGLILGIIGAVILLACIGSFYASYKLSSTPTHPTAQGNVPTNAAVVSSAAAILYQGQTASAVDSNYNATAPTSTFTVEQRIYTTFQINSNGQNGYIEAKWYLNGQEIRSNMFHHSAQNDHGFFSTIYTQAGDGAIALYWCTQANCSDEQLAQVIHFTVTA
jgi:hypothetical protein